jgi:hypothetical protein
MAYRSGSATSSTGTTSVTVNSPIGVAPGDTVVVVLFSSNSNSATFSNPTILPIGFGKRGTGTVTGNFAHSGTFAIYTRIASASEPSSYTFDVTGGTNIQAIAAAWTGRSDATFVSVTNGGSASGGGSFSLPLTGGTAAAGDDIAWFGMVTTNGGAGYSFTAPTGYTSRITAGPGGNADYSNLSTKDNVTAGATGSISGSVTGSSGADGFGIVISLAAAGTTLIGSDQTLNDSGTFTSGNVPNLTGQMFTAVASGFLGSMSIRWNYSNGNSVLFAVYDSSNNLLGSSLSFNQVNGVQTAKFINPIKIVAGNSYYLLVYSSTSGYPKIFTSGPNTNLWTVAMFSGLTYPNLPSTFAQNDSNSIGSLALWGSSTSPNLMRIYGGNNAVQITNIVEVAGATPRLYANGTFVCPKFIELP